jgi:hypothetical protein
MKKILSFALSIILCLMAISCVNNGGEADATSASTTAGTTTATTAATTAPTDPEPEPEPEPLKAGFCEKDITPKKLGVMPGGSGKNVAKTIEMPLLANVAAFESNGSSLIIVSVDILLFQDHHVKAMRERINEATGVPEENIMIAATHTHTGGGLDFQLYRTPADTEAFNNTVDLTVEAAIEAWNTRERAKMGFSMSKLGGYSFCRDAFMKNGDINTWPSKSNIDRLISEVDQSFGLIRVDDADGNLKCFIVSYANHSDSSSKNGYNPDYPGYMRQTIKEELGEDVTILYLNGAQGDVNYCDYLGGGSGGRNNVTIGTALGTKVLRMNNNIVVDNEYPEIKVLTGTYTAIQRHPTKDNFTWAQEIMAKANNGESVASLDKAFATEYLNEDYSDLGDTFEIELQTVVLGDFALVALPCEPFSEIALKIKAGSPFENTVVVGLANGHNGYIAPDFVQGTGAYAARFSKHVNKAGLGTADLLINNSIAMLKEMK